MSIAPIAEREFFAAHGEFVRTKVTPDALEQIMSCGAALLGAVPVLRIDCLLKPDACAELDQVVFNEGGGAISRSKKLPILAAGLLPLMRDMSRLHAPLGHPLDRRIQSIRRLHYSPDVLRRHTLFRPHRDFGEGHSALYNRNVNGPQVYQVGEDTIPIKENQLIVLNSGAEFFPDRGVHGTELHSVEAAPGTSEEELAGLGRDRYLVYCDGKPTPEQKLFTGNNIVVKWKES